MPDVFDHVGIRVSDVEASRPFYELAFGQLGYGEPYRGEDLFEWEDFSRCWGSHTTSRPMSRRR